MATEKPSDRRIDGLECPLCGCPESGVVWTRRRVLKINNAVSGAIVRARECNHCGYRFQTSERVQADSLPPERP